MIDVIDDAYNEFLKMVSDVEGRGSAKSLSSIGTTYVTAFVSYLKSKIEDVKESSIMTDTERERIKAICEIAGVSDIEDLSDGFHTFAQLYYQRMILFATIVKQNKDKAWKSLRHEDGELCFGGGWFIVGIDTPEGSYTYHYQDNYYSLFDCEELERGKHWDGHTEKDVTRLLALPSAQPEIIRCKDCIHRPIIEDPGDIGGFGLRFPDDSKCPCRCDDPYYSWIPNDNWFCGNGEKEEQHHD